MKYILIVLLGLTLVSCTPNKVTRDENGWPNELVDIGEYHSVDIVTQERIAAALERIADSLEALEN